jgi:hypothetical protein
MLSDAQKIAVREGAERALLRTLGLTLISDAELDQLADIIIEYVNDADK